MKKISKHLMDSIESSLNWILPVGLIIATFIILFFGISEQVGNVKSLNAYMYAKLDTLEMQVEDMKTNSDSSTAAPQLVTITKNTDSFTSLKTQTQTLSLTGEKYWGYTFKTFKKLAGAPVVFSAEGVYASFYTTTDVATEDQAFDLLKYSETNKNFSVDSKNYSKLLVFLDGKLIIYNDFENNSKDSLKASLTALQSQALALQDSSALYQNILNVVNSELQNL